MDRLQSDSRFLAWLAASFVVLTIVGFFTTFFLPVALGRFSGEPALVFHGILFLSWPVFFLVQTQTIGRSRRVHRGVGLAGISLATAMVFAGFGAMSSSLASWQARGYGHQAQSVSVIVFGGLVMFAIFFTIGIVNSRDRVMHPRLMFLATLAIMQGAWGRLALLIATHGNPQMLRPGVLPPAPVPFRATLIHFPIDLAILALLAWHDRRIHGKVQRVTWIGGGALLAMLPARHLLPMTAAWHAITGMLAAQ